MTLPEILDPTTRHADGNPPTPENMREHCALCNKLIEEGKLRVVGFAPFERYYGLV